MKLEGAQGTDESQGKHNKGHRVKNKKNGQHKMEIKIFLSFRKWFFKKGNRSNTLKIESPIVENKQYKITNCYRYN